PLGEEYAQRAAEIQAELIEGSAAEWAREYHFGDGLGVNVTFAIAPNRGFISIWEGCLGVYGRSLGTVTESNGKLLLNHEAPNQPGGFGNFSKVLVPVRWGERRYLVGEEQLGEFVNAVNSGYGECTGYCPTKFLLRTGDEDLKQTGRPELPAEYAARLLGEPMYARVTRVVEPDLEVVDDEYRWRKALVELDVGRNGGAWEGMEFSPSTHGESPDTFKIVKVADAVSLAEVTNFNSKAVAPEIGLCVSTHPQSGCAPAPVASE
ncbi:MAG: hypothetical protein ABUL69_02245, partial [Peristeroidobacter soli]